jgi:hypothetical protein
MSTNETLIAIPLDVNEPQELRKFLVKLIVALDVLLGLRGADTGAVTIQGLIDEAFDFNVDLLPAFTQLVGATYDQAEVQAISDAVTASTDKLNELIALLNK